MRLTRLEMHGFRCYQRPTSFEFGPGLNVFCGANEAGKSALMQAVQFCLFLPRLDSDRQACRSDGADVCQIALEYELPAGGRYRLERDLVGNQHALCRWAGEAWQQATTQLRDITREVQSHTGCDQALFERTLLVRHESIEVPPSEDLTSALAARLELLVGGRGKVSAVKAAGKLEDRYKALTGPRAGEIVAAQQRLE